MNSPPPQPERETTRSLIERLFLAAADLSPERQREFVRSRCEGNPELAATLTALLASECETRDAGQWKRAAGLENLRFGRYRVIERIGAGGMGIVYAAVRDDAEYEKKVAIKAIPPGLFTPDGAGILRRERQILAQLEHPNIARLLDGGTTPEGVPWLAMEFVDGRPLLAYAGGLDTPPRLALYLEICEAVAYAHRNLVIHSDIKPGNILVPADGHPKLLDFGIAKLLDARAEVTAPHARSMTADYASPEQLRGGRMTTASDIYSLGLVLCELIAGCHPFPQASTDPAGRDPLPALRGRISGDLRYIILKALAHEPAGRYTTVEQLADDIGRYLHNQPVAARRGNQLYRARKFVQRNRLALSAAAVVLLVAAAAGIAQLESSRSLARRLEAERKLADSVMREVPALIESVPGTLVARQLLVRRATDYLDSLMREAGPDRALRREIAAGYDRVGSITFDTAGALALHRKALELNQALVDSDPRDRTAREQLAATFGFMGNVLKDNGDTGGSLDFYRRGATQCEMLFRADTRNPTNISRLADAWEWLGALLAETGRFNLGLEQQGRAVSLLENATPPGSPRDLMEAYVFLARTLSDTGDHAAELEYSRKIVNLAEALAQSAPASVICRRDIWMGHICLGTAYDDLNDPSAALAEYRAGAPYIESLAAADPGDNGHHRGVAITHLAIAGALARLGRHEEAAAAYRRALAISESLLALDPNKAETRSDLARMNGQTGKLYLARDDLDAASGFVDAALRLYGEASRADPDNARLLAGLAETQASAGDLAARQGRVAEARAFYQSSLTLWVSLRDRQLLRSGDRAAPDRVRQKLDALH